MISIAEPKPPEWHHEHSIHTLLPPHSLSLCRALAHERSREGEGDTINETEPGLTKHY